MTDSQDQASTAALAAMRLPQLQELATNIGLKGTSRMRKAELLDAIKAHSAKSDARSEAGNRRPERAGETRTEEPSKEEPRREETRGERRPARDRRDQRRTSTRQGTREQESLDVLAEFDAGAQESGGVASLDDIQLPTASDDDSNDPNARRRRARDRRDRGKRRTGGQRETQTVEEVDVLDSDELIPIAGVLDVLDNYGFVRTTGYLPGASDVYVNLGMVRRHGLRRGDAITGAVKQPREGESSSRQKFNALVAPELVNNAPLAEAEGRPDFDTLPAVFPQKHLSLGNATLSRKLIDVLAPIALGSRVLVTASPQAPRIEFLADLAQGIAETAPHVHLMMVLIDERPEDATHIQRKIHGEVIAASFDRSGSDHTTVATLAIERAKRLVELGQDVVVVFDSITALARAYHTSTNPSSRILEHGWDASTLLALKQLFGAGRNIENGGSLTLIASGVSASAADEFILSELQPVANATVTLGDSQTGVIIEPEGTATRNLEAIFDVDDVIPRIVLAELLANRDDGAAWLGEQLAGSTGERFLANGVKVTPRQKAEIRRSLA